MTIQEALNKVKDLKAEASKLASAAVNQQTRVYYLDVDPNIYPPLQIETVELLNKYKAIQKEIHKLKLQIQSTNVVSGITALIQELDYCYTIHSALERFGDTEQVTDPILVGDKGYGVSTSSNTFKVIEATYSVSNIKTEVEEISNRISELKLEIQRRNWETELIEEAT